MRRRKYKTDTPGKSRSAGRRTAHEGEASSSHSGPSAVTQPKVLEQRAISKPSSSDAQAAINQGLPIASDSTKPQRFPSPTRHHAAHAHGRTLPSSLASTCIVSEAPSTPAHSQQNSSSPLGDPVSTSSNGKRSCGLFQFSRTARQARKIALTAAETCPPAKAVFGTVKAILGILEVRSLLSLQPVIDEQPKDVNDNNDTARDMTAQLERIANILSEDSEVMQAFGQIAGR